MQEFQFNSKIYHKKLHKRRTSHPFFIILCIITLLIVILSVLIKPKGNTVDFYIVIADSAETYSQASALSDEISNMGGAGYINFDGKYNVIVSFYLNKDSAIKIRDNIKSEFPKASINNLTIDKSELDNIGCKVLSLVDSLIKIDMDYEKQNSSYEQTNVKLTQLKEDFTDQYENYMECNKTNYKLNTNKKRLLEVYNSLSLISESNEQDFGVRLKYHSTKILFNLYYLSL